MATGVIYQVVLDGVIVYVGQTQRFTKRRACHRRYRPGCELEVLEDCVPVRQLNRREKHWIQQKKAEGCPLENEPFRPFKHNRKIDPDRLRTTTEVPPEVREKIRASKLQYRITEEHRANLAAALRRPEVRKKISRATKAALRRPEVRKKISDAALLREARKRKERGE